MRKLTAMILSLTLIMIPGILTPLTALADESGPEPPPPPPHWNLDYYRQRIAELERQLQEQGEGNIQLVSPHNITLEAGEYRDITVTVRNVGSHAARNLFTIAETSANAPFTAEFLRNTNRVHQVGANANRNMTMRITANANAEPGAHTIELTHFFMDEIGRMTDSSSTINVRIGEIGDPTLEIRDMRAPTARVSPGETGTFSFTLYNAGDAEATNISVTAEPSSDDIVPMGTPDMQTISALEPGESREVSFSFSPTDAASTRSYTVQFTVSYGSGDAERSFRQSAAMSVHNEDDDEALPELEFRNMTAPTGQINVGQTGAVSFELYNAGDVEIRNITVTATPPRDSIAPATQSSIVIRELAPGESHAVSFGFRPRNAASTQTYDVEFSATYRSDGDEFSIEQFAAINVYNPDEDEDEDEGRAQIPRVIISQYSLYPAVPRAGEEFEMTITFRNTNATRSVNNIRILMEEVRAQNLPGQQQQEHFAGFTPVGGSNTLFVDRLATHGEITKILRFTTSADATPGMHNMRISFDFQDDAYEERESSEQISIQLAQVMSLELAFIDIMEFASVGSRVPFSFRIINNGRVNLMNVRVRAEGPGFDVTEAGGVDGQFIPPINAQRFATFEGRFIPQEPGDHRGYFVVTGEDNTGAGVEIRHPFMISVDAGFDMDFDMGFDDGFMGGGRPFPDDGMHWDDGMMWQEDEGGGGLSAVGRFIVNIFTRPVEPEHWDEMMFGPFSPETAEIFGMDVDRGVRWPVIIGGLVVIAIAVAIPVIIVVRKRHNRLLFEEDED